MSIFSFFFLVKFLNAKHCNQDNLDIITKKRLRIDLNTRKMHQRNFALLF